MKRKDDESSLSKLDPIPPDLKMIRLPAKFLMKTHQEKRKERDGDDNEDDEKDKSPSKVDPIPHDLELAILTRLPAKSLMRFRCVSKIWSSLIRSQRFVDSYYSMSTTLRSRFLIALSNGPFPKKGYRNFFIFSSSFEREESSSLPTNLDMIVPSTLETSTNWASVHGLIGCSVSGQFIVCNPCTKKVTTLPGARTILGYDPVHGQFKALTMLSLPHQKPDFLVHEVLTLVRGESSWRRKKVVSLPYLTVTRSICINGLVYNGAWTPFQRDNPVIMCFDVRFERISFIKAPMSVVYWESQSILIEYKGKLASIVRHPNVDFHSFELWILEDVKKEVWSMQTFELPFSLGIGRSMTSPGTNKAGEIIFAPKQLSRDVQPFYIFYYNVERKDLRRVRIQGIADTEEFRRRYGFVEQCCVYISPEHVESIASL